MRRWRMRGADLCVCPVSLKVYCYNRAGGSIIVSTNETLTDAIDNKKSAKLKIQRFFVVKIPCYNFTNFFVIFVFSFCKAKKY